MGAHPGVLVLEDETEFPGQLFGIDFSVPDFSGQKGASSRRDLGYGEVIFNTSMTGYQEILTDPSYYGQIICLTVPHVGNTGIRSEESESQRPWCSGLVIRETCLIPSHWKSEQSLVTYLQAHQIPIISGVDTRRLTHHLRSRGVLRGLILPESEKTKALALFRSLPRLEDRDCIREVTTPKPFFWTDPTTPQKYSVVAMDFGIKTHSLRALAARGCRIEVVPAHTSAQEILARKPTGVFLSNGPGDPLTAPYAVDTIRTLLGKIPLFGICMGHQLLGLALGAKTFKMKFGHRGSNQPVLDRIQNRVEMSSHNHGYAIDPSSLPTFATATHINLNDQTLEGLEVQGLSAFSVQYHPEASPGPHDSLMLFDQFIRNMELHVSKVP